MFSSCSFSTFRISSFKSFCTCVEGVAFTWPPRAGLRVRCDRDVVDFTAADAGYLTAGRVCLALSCVCTLALHGHSVPHGTGASGPRHQGRVIEADQGGAYILWGTWDWKKRGKNRADVQDVQCGKWHFARKRKRVAATTYGT